LFALAVAAEAQALHFKVTGDYRRRPTR